MSGTTLTHGQSLAKRISAERTRRGWDQSELARKSGVSRSYVNKLESGSVVRPALETLAKIAGAFGLPVEELSMRERSPDDERLLGQIIAVVGTSPEVAKLTNDILTDLRSRTESERLDILRHIAGLLRFRNA